MDRRPIGVTDDFFELGGDSMLAMSLLAHIVQETDRNLPVAGLMNSRTIERLAAMLGEDDGGNGWSPLVPLQTEGTKRPFFCVHPAGGNALCYLQLSRLLGKDQPFYGLQAPGIDSTREPLTTIEDMAEEYIVAIRQVQPHGPYNIGGWSYGGVLAYDIAQKLRAAGEEVACLAILDAGVLYAFAVLRTVLPERDLGIFDTMRLPVGEQVAVFRERTAAARLIPDEADEDLAARIFRLFVINTKSMIKYRPDPYDSRISLFQAREDFVKTRHRPYGEWTRICENVELHEVPGNHLTMIHEPHIRELATKLGAALDAAR